MRSLLACGLVAALTTLPCLAQVCGPTPAMQASATVDGLYLDVSGSFGSTNSRAAPPDYTASTGLGQYFTINVLSAAGPPGEPLGIYFSLGGPKPPVNLGVPGKDVFLDVGQSTAFPLNFFPLIEGPGLGGNSLGVSTVSPPATFTCGGPIPALASLAGQCLVVQAAALRPGVPFNIALSNAVTLQILPSVQSITPSQILPEAAGVTAIVPGSSPTGDFAILSDGIGGTLQVPAATGAFTIPYGAASGPVGYVFGAAPNMPAVRDPDRVGSWFSVIDTVTSTNAPGTINLNPGSLPGLSRFTAFNILASGTAVDTYTLSLLAGDVVEIEVLSTDPQGFTLLDGWGSRYNPTASQGFNPRVTLLQTANTLPLVFDTIVPGPWIVHRDDDSGPGGNAFLRFQARTSDPFQIRVDSSPAGGFVTGTYILNVRVHGAAVPSVNTIGPALNNPQNLFAPGALINLQTANVSSGAPYNVILSPVHGFFAPLVITGTATSATQVSFTIPASFSLGIFAVGSYRVQIEDQALFRRSMLWPTTPYRPPYGIVPDILVIRAPSPIPAGTTPTQLSANTATLSITGQGGIGAFATITASPGQRIYAEALGIDQSSPGRVDTAAAFSGATNGVWNPHLTLYSASSASGTNQVLAYNDDDGWLPFPFLSSPAGLGDSAVILASTDATTPGSTHYLLAQENICWITCSQAKSGILQVVIQ